MIKLAVMNVLEQCVSYEIFCEGERFGNSSSVELPEMNFKTQTISGAGIAGEYDAPTLGSLESCEIKITFRALYKKVTQLMKQRAVQLSMRGVVQQYDSGTGTLKPLPIRIDARGRVKSFAPGKFEPSELMDSELTFEADVLSVKVNNVEEMLIDKLNFIYRVDGTDYLAEVRTALGI